MLHFVWFGSFKLSNVKGYRMLQIYIKLAKVQNLALKRTYSVKGMEKGQVGLYRCIDVKKLLGVKGICWVTSSVLCCGR